MISFPKEFVEIKYPGYFWNLETKELFSIKVDGELKPLKRRNRNYFVSWMDRWCKWYYCLSYKGRRVYMTDVELCMLEQKDSTLKIKRI